MRMKRAWSLLVAVIMLASLLGACGDNPTATTAPTTTTVAATTTVATTAAKTTTAAATTTASATTTTAAATTAAAATTGTTGAVFHWAKTAEPTTLDPAFVAMTDATSLQITENLFEGLVELDKDLKAIPAAAAAMPDVSTDGKVYTFKLRPGLKFNNGEAVTAADFIYSWNRVAQLGPQGLNSFAFGLIQGFKEVSQEKDAAKRATMTVSGFKAIDASTIQITLTEAGSYFLTEMSTPGFLPVSQKAIEANGGKIGDKNSWASNPASFISNGPYLLKDWKRDASLRLEANPYYTGNPKPAVSVVTIDIVKDATTSKLKYDNGDLDDVGVPLADQQTAPKDPKYKDAFWSIPLARTTWLAFNFATENVFSKNLKLRQAVAYSIDKTLITQGALNGAAITSSVLLPKGFPGYRESSAYAYNVETAKQLFKEAGYDTPEKVKALSEEINNWGGGKSGGLAINSDRAANVVMMESIQQQLKQVLGLEIKVTPVATPQEFITRRDQNHEFLLYRGNWEASYPDPQNFYGSAFLSTSTSNFAGYKNPQYDELVGKANLSFNLSERTELYAQAEKVLQADMAYIPLYNAVESRLIRPTFTNWGYTSQGPMKLKYLQVKTANK